MVHMLRHICICASIILCRIAHGDDIVDELDDIPICGELCEGDPEAMKLYREILNEWSISHSMPTCGTPEARDAETCSLWNPANDGDVGEPFSMTQEPPMKLPVVYRIFNLTELEYAYAE